ncbi:MAG: hypothetical protein KDD36_06340 [Flavobacteriales bacterium]|nr:hypothetical protein [Flavobacteriales bacterium]
MKQKVILFLIGIVLGGLVAGWLVSSSWKKQFEIDYCTDLLGLVNTASEIRFSRHADLGTYIESKLPMYVTVVDREFGQSEAAVSALTGVKNFYMMHSLPVPVEIKPILDALPAQP